MGYGNDIHQPPGCGRHHGSKWDNPFNQGNRHGFGVGWKHGFWDADGDEFGGNDHGYKPLFLGIVFLGESQPKRQPAGGDRQPGEPGHGLLRFELYGGDKLAIGDHPLILLHASGVGNGHYAQCGFAKDAVVPMANEQQRLHECDFLGG